MASSPTEEALELLSQLAKKVEELARSDSEAANEVMDAVSTFESDWWGSR